MGNLEQLWEDLVYITIKWGKKKTPHQKAEAAVDSYKQLRTAMRRYGYINHVKFVTPLFKQLW